MAKPKGGARPGAGRKRGSKTIRTTAVADKVAASGITPLEVMIQAMREAFDAGGAIAAFQYAKEAAPFMHPRLQSVNANVKHSLLEDATDAELDAIIRRFAPEAGILLSH